MNSHSRFGAIAVLLSTFLPTHIASALDISGKAVDRWGKPIPFVRITIASPDSAPYSTSVFTAQDGTFLARDIPGEKDALDIGAFRIGWEEVARDVKKANSDLTISLKFKATDDVAEQVPGSAWLQGNTESTAYRMTTLQCAGCHQLGAPRVRAFASRLASVPVEERAEAWLNRAAEDLSVYDGDFSPWENNKAGESDLPPGHPRINAWENIVQYMRYVTLRLGEKNELRWGITEDSPVYEALLQPQNSLFVPRDMEIIIPYLAHNFPVDQENYPGKYNDIERLGDYGVTRDTRVEEFILPTFGWTREVAVAPGSALIWFVETDKDRLGALDPANGSVEWFDVPGEGPQGPHTINADPDGNLWVALENSFHIGHFNTKTRTWRLYPPPKGTEFGVTHDFALNSDRHVVADIEGRIWITDLGKNELWGVHVETGVINTYRLPHAGGESSLHTMLYGAAIDVENNRVWWAQLNGYVGSFDTAATVTDRIVPFGRGVGPRRIAIQEDGVLWVPLYGDGALSKIDTKTGLELARYSLPDPGAAPYGVTLDKKRNAIWAATAHSDRIYRFDIDSERWRHYPLPRKEAFLRMVDVDPETGDVWTTYSSLPVGKRNVDVHKVDSANNIIVRLHPGD